MIKNTINRVLDVAVTEALTILTTVKTNFSDRLAVQFTVATHDLDQFVIKGQVHPASPEETLYSAAGSFTAPSGLIIAASGDLTTQAAASTGSFVMDVGGYFQITVYAASVHSGGSVVDIYTGQR